MPRKTCGVRKVKGGYRVKYGNISKKYKSKKTAQAKYKKIQRGAAWRKYGKGK